MSTTLNMNERMSNIGMTAEERARALQAAYIGAAATDALAAVGNAVSNLYRRWRVWAERRRSVDHLERMDERLLADIGLSRATLDEMLRHGIRKPVQANATPPVEVAITETAAIGIAANQDHETQRTAA